MVPKAALPNVWLALLLFGDIEVRRVGNVERLDTELQTFTRSVTGKSLNSDKIDVAEVWSRHRIALRIADSPKWLRSKRRSRIEELGDRLIADMCVSADGVRTIVAATVLRNGAVARKPCPATVSPR